MGSASFPIYINVINSFTYAYVLKVLLQKATVIVAYKIIPWDMIIGFVSEYKQKIELKNENERFFFLKVWAKHAGTHYTRERVVHGKIWQLPI